MARRRRVQTIDTSLLEAALIGYEQMKRKIDEEMADIRGRIGAGGSATAAPAQTGRRTLSAVARARIAAAQRKRWAKVKAKGTKTAATRTMSAAARKRIAAAQRKRWAAVKSAQAASAKSAAQKKPAVKTAGAAEA